MYEKITLKNGVRIIFERLSYVRSVSIGIWVGTGSRYEKPGESGASHFIEHMVFKGTETRSAADIAELMDGIGGQINAFTTKECTCFYGKVLDSHLGAAADMLCDMFFNSKFDENDVVNERGVILEEIDMYEDTPDDLVTERLFARVWQGNALSRPILGREKTLRKFTGEKLREYMRSHYTPDRIVISLSGNFTDLDIEYLKDRFSQIPEGQPAAPEKAVYVPAVVTKRKAIEQNHVCLAFPGLPIGDDRRYAMSLMSGMLGGGMSSRLFQSVREKRGLCYTVYSFTMEHMDTGLLGIYAAVGRETEDKAMELIAQEIVRFRDKGVSETELDRAREQAKANVLMAEESTQNRMNRLGRNELFLNSVADAQEIIDGYDSVTREDIHRLAEQTLDFKNASVSAVGRIKTGEKYGEYIEQHK